MEYCWLLDRCTRLYCVASLDAGHAEHWLPPHGWGWWTEEKRSNWSHIFWKNVLPPNLGKKTLSYPTKNPMTQTSDTTSAFPACLLLATPLSRTWLTCPSLSVTEEHPNCLSPCSPSLDSIVLSVVLLKYYSGHVLLMLGPLTLNVHTPQHRNQGPVDTKLQLLHLSLMSHCLLPARHSFNKLYLHMPFLSCANFYTIKKKNTPFKYMICKDFLKTSS